MYKIVQGVQFTRVLEQDSCDGPLRKHGSTLVVWYLYSVYIEPRQLPGLVPSQTDVSLISYSNKSINFFIRQTLLFCNLLCIFDIYEKTRNNDTKHYVVRLTTVL